MSAHRPAMLIDERDEDALRTLQDTVLNQLRDGDPPVVAATLARLTAAGESRDSALRYIACVLSVEFCEILEHGGQFDLERYADNLAALPALPYDEDGI